MSVAIAIERSFFYSNVYWGSMGIPLHLKPLVDANEVVLTEFIVKIGIHYGGMLCSGS